jgi:site-specific DNA-methyltransferase (adenine-specific)
LAYKKKHIKTVKGVPEWVGEIGEVEDKNGNMRNKTFYTEAQKREFIDLVFGQWNYFADTKSLTKATFSMDIPTKAIKILTYKNDIVLDPFAGSGTSLVAAETLDRRWVGIELSPNYSEIANNRVKPFVEGKRQQVIEF